MSNPDSPGPYWQDAAGNEEGWRRGQGSQRDDAPWDGGGGFWRDDAGRGRDQGRSAEPGRSGTRRAGGGHSRDGGDPRPSRHRAPDQYSQGQPPSRRGGNGRGGRLGETAENLMNKLNARGSGAGADRRRSHAAGWDDGARGATHGDDYDRGARGADGRGSGRPQAAGYRDGSGRDVPDGDFWEEQPGRRGSRAGAATGAGWLADTFRSGGNAAAGRRSARSARGDDAEPGGGGYRGDRTALRDRPEFWDGDDHGTRGLRSRITERTGFGGGGARGTGGTRGGGGAGGGRGGWDPTGKSRSERFKHWFLSGHWWRHWTWKKVLAVLAGGCVGVFLVVALGLFVMYEHTAIPTASEVEASEQSSTVLWSNGKLMGSFNDTVNGIVIDRMLLNSKEIPKYMTEAMAAAEDRHFYTEGGVSLTGLMRSAYEDIFGSGNLQGGSTITMQYAKNAYAGVDTGRNFSTKLKEIFIAVKLAHKETKTWIMTNYLNTVDFGSELEGVGAAAEQYFSINLTKPSQTLSFEQAAMLASLPNAPGVFSPVPGQVGYTALVARYQYVLTNMFRDNDITAAQEVYGKAHFPTLNQPAGGDGQTGTTAYLMNMVDQQLQAPAADGGYGLTQQQINTGGYQIKTTFSQAKMKTLAQTISQEKAQMRQDAEATGLDSFRNYDRIGSVLEDAKTGGILAIYGGPGWPTSQSKKALKVCGEANCYLNTAEDAEQVGSSFKPYVLATAVSQGMSVFTSKLDGYAPIWIPEATNSPAGAISIELVKSRNSPPAGVQSSMPGGYATNAAGAQVYWYKFPEASENTGVLPVSEATAISSDPAYEDLLHRTSVDAVIAMAKKFGVGQTAFVNPCPDAEDAAVPQTIADCNDLTGPDYHNKFGWGKGNGLEVNFASNSPDHGDVNTPGSLQMALGQNPLTPIEQASTFATLADDGLYHTPHVIASMKKNGSLVASPLPAARQVLNPAQAADVDYALSFDNNSPGGTAEGAVSFRRGDLIAKTGTLGNAEESSEAWFIGAEPDQDSMAVDLFTALQTQNLDNLPATGGQQTGSYGGAWPATIFNAYMTKILPSTGPSLFQSQAQGFVPWIQVQPKKTKPVCKPGQGHGGQGGQGGQFKNCTCPKGAQFCANPGPTCHGFGDCGSTSPSPGTSTCPPGQQQCGTSTSPSPSPDPSPSATCTPTPGQPCIGAATTALITSALSSSASSRSSPALLADEPRTLSRAVPVAT